MQVTEYCSTISPPFPLRIDCTDLELQQMAQRLMDVTMEAHPYEAFQSHCILCISLGEDRSGEVKIVTGLGNDEILEELRDFSHFISTVTEGAVPSSTDDKSWYLIVTLQEGAKIGNHL